MRRLPSTLLWVCTVLAILGLPPTELPPPGPGKPPTTLPGPLEEARVEARRAQVEEEARERRDASLRLNPTSAVEIAVIAGPGSHNQNQTRWNVHGADLGHLFRHRGSLYIVFGDTFGEGPAGWRSNTMARIADGDPVSGLVFADMVADGSGHARELLASEKVPEREHTVIPTFGASVGGRMVLHYMSVRVWTAPGRWEVNYSGLAYSDDGGVTWVKDPSARWPATSNFAQVAIIEHDDALYLFGIPAGRFGGLHLARVDPAAVLDPSAYRYWDGEGWNADSTAGVTVVPAPVGELSVEWSPYHGRWLMLYLDETLGAIVLRSATELVGPWSPVEVVATGDQYPTLYAPYIVPGTLDGPDVYFTMSRFSPYAVFLMRTTIPRRDTPVG